MPRVRGSPRYCTGTIGRCAIIRYTDKVRIHLVVEGGNETLCGRNRDDVVDCVDLQWYVEHHLEGTEDLMVTLATTAMVLSRLVRAIFQVETPDPEQSEVSGPLCQECDACTGFYILEAYSVKHDE